MYGDVRDDKPGYVRRMFAAIAGRYDVMNRLMTLGRDEGWRRRVVRELALPPGSDVLDVATGTGDIARQVMRSRSDVRVAALDFCVEMMQAGRAKFAAPELAGRVAFVCGDALRLPYPDGSFGGVATGFALRNVADVPTALAEMLRVLRPGGRMVCLEISRPRQPLIARAYWLYFFRVVPLLGRLISGQGEAYAYLPASAHAFLPAPDLAALMERVGFRAVRFHRLMLGAVAIHVGEKGRNT